MKNIFLFGIVSLCFLSACRKTAETGTTTNADTASGFTRYTIRKGQQYCDQNVYKTVETSEMKFTVKFDSTAIYQTVLPENQEDINKLYGFSDNNSAHHDYSARFGWRWSVGALRLFAYIYNEGGVLSKELATAAVGTEIHCSIQVETGNYLFTVNGTATKMPRMAGTLKGKGYQLYPYFGGDETAPHDIHIWIKTMP